MAHIQSTYARLWKPQSVSIDKVNSQMMFIDNIDALEAFALSILKRSSAPVMTLDELRAIDTSDSVLYTTGMTILVKSHGLYFFDRGNIAADDGKNIIAPAVGGGRWISNLSSISDININDQTPTYSQASTLTNIVSGERLSISMGKISKAIAHLISHNNNKTNPHSVTASQVGLGNVPNVATNDQTPTYTTATTLATLTSGEKLSVSMGKIMKGLTDLISHLASKSNPHAVTAAQVSAIPVTFSADRTSTNEDDLIAILNDTLSSMPDNSTKVIRVNFSMQHEHFINGISATIVVYRLSSIYGNATAITCSPYPDMFIKGFNNGTWGDWMNTRGSGIASASVE